MKHFLVKLWIKLRKNGLIWCCRRIWNELFNRITRLVKQIIGVFVWLFPRVQATFPFIRLNDRRLLVIYDLSCQPFSIGDVLVIQEASLVLRCQYHLDIVDFALVYNPTQPVVSVNEFSSITPDNAMYHLASILPIAQVNPYLGSLFLFDSHIHLQRFIAHSTDLYYVWPPVWKLAQRKYLYYTILNELLYTYYQQHGTIPYLLCRHFLVDWAQTFYQTHIYPLLPVTVNIRNNKLFHTYRNSQLECWLEFFQYCETRYPVKFIVICARIEIDKRIRECTNVLLAKDYDTTIEQDLALIRTSAMHLGASSGPSAMAVFNENPYLIVNADPISYRGMTQEGQFFSLCFAKAHQHFAIGLESTELLITEFEKMWESIDIEWWRSTLAGEQKQGFHYLTWLR